MKIDRDILPAFKGRLLTEITSDDLRALCMKVKNRGAPATAIHVRDIVKQVYAHAIMHGEKVANPADEVSPSSIATFAPNDRAPSGKGIAGAHPAAAGCPRCTLTLVADALTCLPIVGPFDSREDGNSATGLAVGGSKL